MKKGVLLLGLAALHLTLSQPARAEDETIEVQVVNALNKAFGAHPGLRANHAKGVVVEGSFKASADAAKLSRAAIFDGSTIPVTVRFSNSTGIPDLPDGAPAANPHGMAIKFHLPDGSETDMVTNSLKFFVVSTAEEFRDLFLAIADSPPDAPKPTKFEQFVAAHPTLPAAAATIGTPASFADENYFGIDAFIFVNKDDQRQAVRYIIEPERLVHLSPEDAAKQKPNFLMDEIVQRLQQGPVTFRLKAQLAAPGDQTSDPAKPWPDDRPVADLGVLTIDKAVADSKEAEKPLLFLPGQIIDGIELSDDPLVSIRDGAYAESFSRRNP
jgi:catalase